MKKLYLDSANIEEVKRIAGTRAIAGVTTNPSLMAKEKKGNYLDKLREIAIALHDGSANNEKKHLSVEVITLNATKMLEQASEYYDALSVYNLDVYIKIPVTIENLSVITSLTKNNINVNATACMMKSQAKMAYDAGAHVLSFFYNRMKDGQVPDPENEIYESANLQALPGLMTKRLPPSIICGSIRQPQDVYNCWNAGANAVTASMKIIELLMSHPETDKAITGFQRDIDLWLK